MSEQRLVDADTIYYMLTDIDCQAHFIDNCEALKFAEFLETKLNATIDPETLPIVRELREKLQAAERDSQHWKKMYDQADSACVISDKKLSWYEKAEQEGRLVVVPDKLYDLLYDEEAPEKSYITEYNTDGIGIKFAGDYIKPDEIGETVFLTREEAEAALKARDDH